VLELIPADAVNDLAVSHNQLGTIYSYAGDLDRALSHFRDSIRYEEQQGNLYGSSQTRFNVAVALADAGRIQDALAYAEAALRGFDSYGESAEEDVQRTRRLIEQVRQGSNLAPDLEDLRRLLAEARLSAGGGP
jgi:tetratricopeptide (TPR) repeat protein